MIDGSMWAAARTELATHFGVPPNTNFGGSGDGPAILLAVAQKLDVEIGLQTFDAAFLAVAAVFYTAERRFRV